MPAIANVLIGLVAVSHLGFLVLEMFLWNHPVGPRIFGTTPEVAAGLLWALAAGRHELKIFFLREVQDNATRWKENDHIQLMHRLTRHRESALENTEGLMIASEICKREQVSEIVYRTAFKDH